MPGALLTLLLALVMAITFWRPLRRVRRALGTGRLLATGHFFLILGVLLGLGATDGSASYAEGLRPVVAFTAGWIGFATGMRFELRVLRTVPFRAFATAILPAIAAAILVGAAAAVSLRVAGADDGTTFGGAILLAAAAASSGPTLAAIVRARRAGRATYARPVLQMVEFSAGFGDLLVIVLALLAFSLFGTSGDPLAPGVLLMFAVSGGATLGVVTWLFLGGRASEDERLLLGLAMLAFVAGLGGWLRTSPAAVSAIAAIVLVNLPGERMAVLVRAVRRVERPAVVILMIAIGFHSAGELHPVFFPLAVALTALRLGAKLLASELVAGREPLARGLVARKRWGYGLAPQGTLGLMMALSFHDVWGGDYARAILAAVAAASVVNEVVGQWLMLRLVRHLSHREVIIRAEETAA